MHRTDFVVAGAGIVGLATAYQLLKRNPGRRLVVLEKEERIALHQSGRNSGVLHSGIYYKPGSLKAVNCRKGKAALEQFCTEQGIPFERCGKLIVATSAEEEGRLQALLERGQQNGIDCRLLTREQMLLVEPHVAGLAAIHIPETGIVDFKEVCRRLSELIHDLGGTLVLGERVVSVEVEATQTTVTTSRANQYVGDRFVNCGGLYSDHIARLAGVVTPMKIVPFKGEYYNLTEAAQGLVRGLIYPVPDPRFPFLGVHFTRLIGGGVECGPNAVLAPGREGYGKVEVNWPELWETLRFSGFRKLALRYWKTGAQEVLRSLSKARYTRSLQTLVPAVRAHHLTPRPPGIRAQAVLADGSLLDDFLIERQQSAVHVLNAPSPAATACLTIGEQIASMV